MTAQWTRTDVNPITLVLEAAFGADITTDPSLWTWTDITTRFKGQQIEITRGRADESADTAPTSVAFDLDNTDSALSPNHPSSPWLGKWDIGTPMRIKVKNPTTAVTFVRAQGLVADIEQNFPVGNSVYSTVTVTLKGDLYRLGQGDDLRSAMYRIISAGKPVAYWSMEDDKYASFNAEYHGQSPLFTAPAPTFSSGAPTSGASGAVVTMNALTVAFAPVSMTAGNTAFTVEFFMNLPSAQSSVSYTNLWEWTTPQGGPVAIWHLVVYVNAGNDTIALEGFDIRGNRLLQLITPFLYNGAEAYGVDLYVSACVRLNAGAIQYEFAGNTYGGIAFSASGGSITGTSVGAINKVYFPFAGLGGWTFGHLSIWNTALDTSFGTLNFPNAKALNGQSGDGAETRIVNLAAAAGVPLTMRATLPLAISTKMGPIVSGSALAGMRAAEHADIGILSDGLNAGISYLPRSVRYNAAVAMSLDAAATVGQVKVPFAPSYSDQRVRTAETVSRNNGASVTATGPKAANQGVRPEQISLNVADDSTLADQAYFRLNLNSVNDVRVPSIIVDFRDHPELIQQWLDSCDLGSRIQVVHLPTQFPLTTLDYVIEQWKETIGSTTWRVEILGSPYAPWRAFVLDSATLGRLDTGGSTLGTTVTSSSTSWSVATIPGNTLWTTKAGDFPLDLNCEGEQIRVTNITGSSSPQTFTVTRSVNGVSKAHTSGVAISLYQPAVLAL